MADKKESLAKLRIDRGADQAGNPGLGLGVWALAGFSVLVAAAILWFWLGGEEVRAVETVVVREPAATTRGSSVLDATGYVVARRLATVSSKFTGRVKEVMIEEGMFVEAGQVVAILDDSTERTQLDLSRARLDSARASQAETRVLLANGRRTLRRTEELAERKLSSQAELDAARADVDTLVARLATGERDIEVAARSVAVQQQRVDDTTIRAPFSGVVIAKTAQPGEMISPVSAGGGFTRTGIGTIVDMDSLEIEVDVNESYIQRVRSGQRVTARLDAYPDWNIPAEVIAIVPTADRQKATVKVRIGFLERDERIFPDMGVRVAFLQGDSAEQVISGGEISIPAAAVFSDETGDAVLVVEGDTLARLPVVVSRRDGRRAWIESGLVGGERIVVQDVDDLRAGMKVTIN